VGLRKDEMMGVFITAFVIILLLSASATVAIIIVTAKNKRKDSAKYKVYFFGQKDGVLYASSIDEVKKIIMPLFHLISEAV